MCTLFEEIAKENRAEGEAKGRAEGEAKGRAEGEAKGRTEGEVKGIIETGVDLGLPENEILERLQNKLNLSLQAAQEYIKIFGKQSV